MSQPVFPSAVVIRLRQNHCRASKKCILGNDCLVSSLPTSHSSNSSSSSSSSRYSFCLKADNGRIQFSLGLRSSTLKHTACHMPASGTAGSAWSSHLARANAA
ncbi:hypothetical protein WJX82_009801 [Trebouxia sp. C0006]